MYKNGCFTVYEMTQHFIQQSVWAVSIHVNYKPQNNLYRMRLCSPLAYTGEIRVCYSSHERKNRSACPRLTFEINPIILSPYDNLIEIGCESQNSTRPVVRSMGDILISNVTSHRWVIFEWKLYWFETTTYILEQSWRRNKIDIQLEISFVRIHI
jgi:hypothetical protein